MELTSTHKQLCGSYTRVSRSQVGADSCLQESAGGCSGSSVTQLVSAMHIKDVLLLCIHQTGHTAT